MSTKLRWAVSKVHEMLDLELEKESNLLQLPVLLRSIHAGKATYTNLALWDTGAEMSGICEELATWLQLEPRDEGMYMQSASETVSVKVANCQIELPSGELFEQDVLILPTNDTPVIIGLDIIKQGLFSLEPDGDILHFHYEIKESWPDIMSPGNINLTWIKT